MILTILCLATDVKQKLFLYRKSNFALTFDWNTLTILLTFYFAAFVSQQFLKTDLDILHYLFGVWPTWFLSAVQAFTERKSKLATV